MSLTRLMPLWISIVISLIAPLSGSPAPNAPKLLTAAQWAADLKFLAETLPAKHRNAFDRVKPEVFRKAVTELEARLPSLSDQEIIVGLARLVAIIRDGHSRLTLPLGSGEAVMPAHMGTPPAKEGLYFRVLPVKLVWLSDGLFVQAAPKARENLLGARVLRIGAMTAEAALEAVRPVVNYDSEMSYKSLAPRMLGVPDILYAQKITESPGEAVLSLRLRDGRETTERLPAVDPTDKIDWITVSQTAKAPRPLYLKKADDSFWFEFDPALRLFYCQINGVQDKPDETLAAFAGRMVAAAETAPFAKFVLDLRLNGGGNNYLNRTLVLALVRSVRINRYGTFFTIIGRETFSAAQNLVNDLEKWTNVIFVGEPTGNSPSMYGDSRGYTLPNSRLTVRLSSVYWRDSDVDENRPWVAADLSAPLSSADLLENRDPALARILAYEAPDSLLDQLKEKFEWGGMSAAANHYYRYRNSPETAAVGTEKTMLGLAEYLLGRSKSAEASQILQRATVEYPKSFDAFFGLGRLLVAQGDKVKAIDVLKKALVIRPADPAAKEWLAKAEGLK